MICGHEAGSHQLIASAKRQILSTLSFLLRFHNVQYHCWLLRLSPLSAQKSQHSFGGKIEKSDFLATPWPVIENENQTRARQCSIAEPNEPGWLNTQAPETEILLVRCTLILSSCWSEDSHQMCLNLIGWHFYESGPS